MAAPPPGAGVQDGRSAHRRWACRHRRGGFGSPANIVVNHDGESASGRHQSWAPLLQRLCLSSSSSWALTAPAVALAAGTRSSPSITLPPAATGCSKTTGIFPGTRSAAGGSSGRGACGSA